MRRLCVVIVLSMLTLGTLWAGGSPEAAEPAAEQVVLDYWHFRTEDVDAYQELIDRFEAENPGIEVRQNAIKNTEYNTVLSAALQAGEAPDIIMLRSYGGLEGYAQQGYLVPLDDEIPSLADFSRDVLAGAKSVGDGMIYGVPFATRTLVVFYNKAMYQELGLQEPVTWDQFLANLQAVRDAGIEPLANGGLDGWTLEILHGALGPNFYGGIDFFNDVVAGDTTFEDSRYVASLEQMLDLMPYFQDLFMSVSYTDMQQLFINEMACHFIGGDFEIGYFTSQNPDLDLGMFAAPVARRGDPRYVSVWSDGAWGLSSDSENQDAGVKFLEFLSRTESQQYLTESLKVLTGAPGVQSTDPLLAELLEMRETTTPYIHLVGFRYEQPTGSALLQSALQGMFSGEIGPEEVARQVQEGLATWYEPFQ